MLITLFYGFAFLITLLLGIELQRRVISGENGYHYMIISGRDGANPRPATDMPSEHTYMHFRTSWFLRNKVAIVNLCFIRNVLLQFAIISFVLLYDRIGPDAFWMQVANCVAALTFLLWYFTKDQLPKRSSFVIRSY